MLKLTNLSSRSVGWGGRPPVSLLDLQMDIAAVLAYPSCELNDLSGQMEPSQMENPLFKIRIDRRNEGSAEISKSLLIGLKVAGTARASGASNQRKV